MLIVDDREDLGRELGKLDIEFEVTRLEYGDYTFEGHGQCGRSTIGVERKRLQDLINSMTDRRLTGSQLRGCVESYDYLWLVVEDQWRPGPGGAIDWLRGNVFAPFYGRDRMAVSYRQAAAYLNSLTLRCRTSIGEPLRVMRTNNARETAAWLVALYKGFTEKTWDEHHAHDQIYAPGPMSGVAPGGRVGIVQEKVTYAWKFAAQCPALDRRALAAAKHFGSGRRMANATVEEWMEVREAGLTKGGRRKPGIGRETAEKIVAAWREGERQDLCHECTHKESDHEVEDDHSYCLGGTDERPCMCREFEPFPETDDEDIAGRH